MFSHPVRAHYVSSPYLKLTYVLSPNEMYNAGTLPTFQISFMQSCCMMPTISMVIL